jgi:WD40 repeat protein
VKDIENDDYERKYDKNSIIDDNFVEIIDLDQVKLDPEEDDVSQFDLSTLPKSKYLLFEWQRSITHKQVRSFLTICLVLLLIGVGILSAIGGFAMFGELGSLMTGARKLPSSGNVKAQQFPMNIAAANVLLPQATGFVCLSDSAWSPDSRSIAIVGYRKTCMMDGLANGAGLVAIYDIFTGKLLARIQPDAAVLQSLHTADPHPQSAPILNYTQVLWSPHGNRIAVPFTIQFQQTQRSQIMDVTAYTGVVVMDAHGDHLQVILHAQSGNGNSATAEWDLVQGKALAQPTFLAKPTPTSTALSPATMYMWGTNGSLIPEQFEDSEPSPLVPIGDPSGGYAFTIWQPGVVILNNVLSDGAASIGPAIYTLDSNFGAWSPDGRYLISTQVESRLEFSGEPQPTQQALNALNVSQLPLLQVRDKALQHVLDTLSGPATSTNLDMTSWRPDGTTLAVYDASTTDLDVYDCGTGYQLDSLLLSTKTMYGNLNGSYMLRWSPNGEHLILFDPDVGSVILWNVPG